MVARPDEPVWLSELGGFSLAELAERSGLSESEVRELVDYGVIAPVDPGADPWAFSGECLVKMRTACRLRTVFELESGGLAIVLVLLDRIHDLEAELAALRARSPHL